MNKFFLHQIKHNEGGAFDKGVVIKDTLPDAKQSYHAYLGAYAYGNAAEVDYVQCFITDSAGAVLMAETWSR